MSSPFKRSNGFGSSSFGILLFLLFAFICTTKLYLPIDPQSLIGEYNNYYNNNDKSKIIINSIRNKNLTPIHHPTHLVTDDPILGTYIHNGGGYKVLPRGQIAHIVVNIIQAGVTDENDIPQLLGDLMYVLSPDQLEDIFRAFHYLVISKKNGGHVSDQAAVDFLIKIHDDKVYRRTVVKGRHQEILNDFFNNTTSIKHNNDTNNFNLAFPKHIGPPINERPLALFMATNQETPKGKSRRREDGDARRRRGDNSDEEGTETEQFDEVINNNLRDLLSPDHGVEGINEQEGSDEQDEDNNELMGSSNAVESEHRDPLSDENIELYTESPNEYDDNEVLTEGRLEVMMDTEGEDSTASSTDSDDKGVDLITESVESGSRFALGPRFTTTYGQLLSQTTSSPGRPVQAKRTKITEGDFAGQFAIAPNDFHRYMEDLEASIMAHPADHLPNNLMQELNDNRDMLGVWLMNILPPILRPLINLGSPFDLSHLNLFLKHYSPTGVLSAEGDDLNHMRDTQCCIHTVWSKLCNFLANENDGVDMDLAEFGGRAQITNSGYEGVLIV